MRIAKAIQDGVSEAKNEADLRLVAEFTALHREAFRKLLKKFYKYGVLTELSELERSQLTDNEIEKQIPPKHGPAEPSPGADVEMNSIPLHLDPEAMFSYREGAGPEGEDSSEGLNRRHAPVCITVAARIAE